MTPEPGAGEKGVDRARKAGFGAPWCEEENGMATDTLEPSRRLAGPSAPGVGS